MVEVSSASPNVNSVKEANIEECTVQCPKNPHGFPKEEGTPPQFNGIT